MPNERERESGRSFCRRYFEKAVAISRFSSHKRCKLPWAIPHNSAARCAVPFPSSSSCKNLDLPPVNLRFLQANLTKNSLAHRPPHLCGIALRKKRAVSSCDPASLAEGGGAKRRREFLASLRKRRWKRRLTNGSMEATDSLSQPYG